MPADRHTNHIADGLSLRTAHPRTVPNAPNEFAVEGFAVPLGSWLSAVPNGSGAGVPLGCPLTVPNVPN